MTATQNTTRSADSTDRTLMLTASSSPARLPEPAAARLGGAARRFLNKLMNALAAPNF